MWHGRGKAGELVAQREAPESGRCLCAEGRWSVGRVADPQHERAIEGVPERNSLRSPPDRRTYPLPPPIPPAHKPHCIFNSSSTPTILSS